MRKCAKLLAKNHYCISFIESATCGYLAYRFGLTPQSGKILVGGLVCYDLKVKKNVLGVPHKLVKKHSPESLAVTEALARRAPKLFACDIYVACTGLLKRGGSETKAKPVGTFFYSILYQDKIYNQRCYCTGTHQEKLDKVLKKICKTLIKLIKKH